MRLFLILALFVSNAFAINFTDIKFGTKQMGDAQWSVSGCVYTTTCTSSGQAVGSMRAGNGVNFTLGATQYLKFSYTNTDPAEPWTITAYNANGTVATVLGTYRIINAGQGYFMTSNAPHPNAGNGTLWSTQSGMVSGSKTFTTTLQPTQEQMNSLANSYYSPDPIYTAGQTYSPPQIYSATITTQQQSIINAARARQTINNQVNIDQIGSYNDIDVVQSGTYHLVDVIVNNNSNNIDIAQYGIRNYTKVDLNGTNNTSNVYQSNSGGAAVVGHFSTTTVVGNNNTANITQIGDGEKQNFTNINGSNNTINNLQNGTGTKYSDIKTTGNGHIVTLDQKDGGNHAARIDVTNAGGASNINVLQQGNTSQIYSIQQSCATVSGCAVTLTQQ
jgi:hypothetical protein